MLYSYFGCRSKDATGTGHAPCASTLVASTFSAYNPHCPTFTAWWNLSVRCPSFQPSISVHIGTICRILLKVFNTSRLKYPFMAGPGGVWDSDSGRVWGNPGTAEAQQGQCSLLSGVCGAHMDWSLPGPDNKEATVPYHGLDHNNSLLTGNNGN